MASQPHESLSSLINRLFSLAGTTPESESDSDHDSDHPDPNSDRIVLINPFTQGMVVIRGSRATSMGFESLMNDLIRKDEGQPPASQASIAAMPTFEIKGEEEIESIGGECVICLEEWGVGDVAKEMPCKHRFHGGCVEKWLKIHGSCPVCRHEMPVEDKEKEDRDKIGNNGERRGRREIWVSFSFGNGSSTER